ncbi:MAG: hypothetical protein IJL15_01655 [Clostridia bacterium]|nr:hypothetical protein [Clostridia bacterium]
MGESVVFWKTVGRIFRSALMRFFKFSVGSSFVSVCPKNLFSSFLFYFFFSKKTDSVLKTQWQSASSARYASLFDFPLPAESAAKLFRESQIKKKTPKEPFIESSPLAKDNSVSGKPVLSLPGAYPAAASTAIAVKSSKNAPAAKSIARSSNRLSSPNLKAAQNQTAQPTKTAAQAPAKAIPRFSRLFSIKKNHAAVSPARQVHRPAGHQGGSGGGSHFFPHSGQTPCCSAVPQSGQSV